MLLSAASATTPPTPLASSRQLILVTTPGWHAVNGTLQRYQRTSKHRWKKFGAPISIVVGKTGLGWGKGFARNEVAAAFAPNDPIKKEGDGRSPAGVFALGTSFGYAPASPAAWKLPYLSLTPSIECVDDQASKFYNQVVDRASVTPDWNSSEHMRDTGEYYRWGIVVEHNMGPAEPGGGSCIFIHIWGGPGQGTVGCTAMAQTDLEQVLAWLDPAEKPLLVQLPKARYKHLRRLWQLP